jgi:hypothetical protein
MASESSVPNRPQVERAERLRRQIERLKVGRIPEARTERDKPLKEQIEERLGEQTREARSNNFSYAALRRFFSIPSILRRNGAVRLSLLRATSSGEPEVTTSPPASPASGPISRT